LTLLLSLVRQDSSEARKLLYECGDRRDDLAVECLSIEAVFDRDRAVNRLNELLAESPDWNAAHTLLELGDARGIPALLELLDDSFDANRSLAFSSLRRYTQEDIAYDADAPVDQRRAAAERWRAWWRSAQRTFVVKTNAAWIEIECCRL
jgi:hypothetical protein